VLSSFDWRVAIYTAAALATVGVIRPRREHDLNLLIGVTCVFFVVMAILALVAPHSGLHHWTPALSLATLAVIAFGSLVVHRPFTLPIARRSTPEEYWHTPTFLHINEVITEVWAPSFTVSAVFCALIIHTSPSSSAPVIVTQIAAFVVPAVFTKRYTDRAKASALLAAGR
jgi:hypothetical protein